MSRRLLPAIAAALSLNACLFDAGGGPPPRPRTSYDFTRLDSLAHPLSRWYPLEGNKSLVGVQFAFRTMDYEREADSNITAFALEAGNLPATAGAYFDLSSRPENIRRFLDAVSARGVIPFVTLDPKDWDEPDTAYQRTFIRLINEGRFDSSLSAQAAALRDFGKPALFRFGHEMNGNWYPYSGAFAGGKADADGDGRPDGPQNYAAAWRRVHGLFAAAGADKLVWIFCPNWETFPDEEWNLPFSYYPGSAYVDLVSVDAYEHADKRLIELEDVLDGFYNEMGLFLEAGEGDPALAPRPFGLSEFGTSRRDAAAKGDWYDAALRHVAGDGRIRFHALYNGSNGPQDFSIAGLGARLEEAFAAARFQFGFAEPAAER